MVKIKVFIVADDYTGALDTGAQFTAYGARVLVITGDKFLEAVACGEADTDATCGEAKADKAYGEPAANEGCGEEDTDADLFARVKDCDVLAVDAETRHVSPAEASEIVKTLTRGGIRLGFTHFYKKTDSALRGNVGAELAAMLETAGGGALAFAPAYPKSGRVTAGGIQYVNGKPLAESVFADDPFNPIKTSIVSEIIKTQTDATVVNYTADTYRGAAGGDVDESGDAVGGDAVGGEVAGGYIGGSRFANGAAGGDATSAGCAKYAAGGEVADGAFDVDGFAGGADDNVIEIYDAESDADLLGLGYFLKERNKLKCLAGCAGFAGVLPEILGMGTCAARPDKRSASILSGAPSPCVRPAPEHSSNILLVTGSVNPVTFRQLEGAAAAGFRIIVLGPEQKLFMTRDQIGQITATAGAALSAGENVIVAAAACESDVKNTDRLAVSGGIKPADLRSVICGNIARLTASILASIPAPLPSYSAGVHYFITLAVIGGDTLREISARAGIYAVSPIREITPGIIESEALSERGPLRLITKSGGLGGDYALSDMLAGAGLYSDG